MWPCNNSIFNPSNLTAPHPLLLIYCWNTSLAAHLTIQPFFKDIWVKEDHNSSLRKEHSQFSSEVGVYIYPIPVNTKSTHTLEMLNRSTHTTRLSLHPLVLERGQQTWETTASCLLWAKSSVPSWSLNCASQPWWPHTAKKGPWGYVDFPSLPQGLHPLFLLLGSDHSSPSVWTLLLVCTITARAARYVERI